MPFPLGENGVPKDCSGAQLHRVSAKDRVHSLCAHPAFPGSSPLLVCLNSVPPSKLS